MRFARLHGEPLGIPAGLAELADSAALDFLQLDYPRPRQAVVEGDRPAELPSFAQGFADALRVLAKTLYLEPQLRVMASAGWESAFDCIEQAAGALVEGGCGDAPVAAVRGSNLLPILEMLRGQGVDLRHADTGAPFHELRAPLLAADLQLGAGPLVSALAEGARVIVAGCFDAASPTTAVAVSEFNWSWSDADRLAAAALAARAAEWRDWQATEANGQGAALAALSHVPIVDIESSGRATVQSIAADKPAAERLQSWLRSNGGGRSAAQADVKLDASRVACAPAGPGQLAVESAKGAAPDNRWRLEILYEAGFGVELMIEFSPEATGRFRRQIADIARSHVAPENAGSLLAVQELQPLSAAGNLGWLHVHYQSKSQKACQHVVEQTLRLTSRRDLLRLASGPPAVHVQCGLWPARVPRDAVDIAVETRVAKEWI